MSEEQVRRLLARARHTAPVPDDVAARLDAALRDAAHADGREPAATGLDELAARRRRRRWTGALAAAAVVVVAGVGLGATGGLDLSGAGGEGSGSDSAGGALEAPGPEGTRPGSTPPGSEGPDVAERDEGAPSGSDDPGFSAESDPRATARGLPVVRDGSTLVADLVDAARTARPDLRVVAPCAPRTVEGERVRVRFAAGSRATEVPAEVVLVPAGDGARRAEVWSCVPGAADAAGPLRSAVLPRR